MRRVQEQLIKEAGLIVCNDWQMIVQHFTGTIPTASQQRVFSNLGSDVAVLTVLEAAADRLSIDRKSAVIRAARIRLFNACSVAHNWTLSRGEIAQCIHTTLRTSGAIH